MKVIILAAGIGNRLAEINKIIPKCLIEIGEKTLLERQLGLLNECGIKEEDVYVVIGGNGEVWNNENKNKIKKIHKNIIINEKNIELSSTYSLWLGVKDINEDILCLDGDLLFNKEAINKVIDSEYDSAILTKKGEGFKNGNRVLVKKDRVLGISPNILSDRIHSGVVKFGKEFLKAFKKECISEKYFNTTLNAPIHNLCIDNFIYNINLDDNNDEDLIFLNGGSHAITKEIISFNDKNLKGDNFEKIIRKEAIEGKEKLINEVQWILNLPEDIKKHFPKIIKYDFKTDPVYVEMEKYPMKTLRRLLMKGEITSNEALEILENVFDFMFNKVYPKSIKPTPKELINNIYFRRINDRLEEVKRKAAIFNDIIDGEEIIINGKKFPNIKKTFDELKENRELIKILSLPTVGLIHGDLHFDNILVDKKDFSKFVLIDPRGKMYGSDVEGDYAYDLGKIWHSLNGLYDFLHDGKFDLEIKIKNKTIYANFSIFEDDSLKEYKKIFSNIQSLLYRYDMIKKDPYWITRTKFNEVVHFCSMIPFHIKGDGKENLALALYLRGVMLLNNFLSELEFHPIKPEMINMNTPQDYFEAKRIFEEKNRT
ncbi:NTP transferase domain-containing protein [Candidatus Pacearchaeota archaeon]|nr:NTP transferase domain-containing protein [Candidatus Pacearchaeota archaeon]